MTTPTTITAQIDGETEEVDLLTHDALVENYTRFLVWAETAEGCDWCCGGGDRWRDRLHVQREALGFTSWTAFVAASPNFVDPRDAGEGDDNG